MMKRKSMPVSTRPSLLASPFAERLKTVLSQRYVGGCIYTTVSQGFLFKYGHGLQLECALINEQRWRVWC